MPNSVLSLSIRPKSVQRMHFFVIGFIFCCFILLSVYYIDLESISKFELRTKRSENLEFCPASPPNRQGELEVDFANDSLDVVDARLSIQLDRGGWFTPKECKARDRVAIIVPMKDRMENLPIFLKNIHRFLMKQQIEYGIYVVEQVNDEDFNKGALFNIGFIQAMKMKDWECFIFHDIDLIPCNDHNLYKCPREGPLHMGVAIDRFNYTLRYDGIYGGVSAFTTEHFKQINGYSNLFWNWGGEDDDLKVRVLAKKFPIRRPPESIARYRSLKHPKESKYNQNWALQVDDSPKFLHVTGLNSVKYHIKEFKVRSSFIHIIVDKIEREHPKPEQ